MSTILYSWKFSDIKNRSPVWYVIALAVVVGIAVWGVLTKQYGLSFLIVLVTGIVFFVENNAAEIIEVHIHDTGIEVENNFYEFENIQQYSYVYHKESPVYIRLYLGNARIGKKLDIQIDANTRNNLEAILPEFIQQGEKQHVSFIEKMITLLKL